MREVDERHANSCHPQDIPHPTAAADTAGAGGNEWPSGATLPDTMRSWASSMWNTAGGELRLAYESVLEDLEGLSAAVGTGGDEAADSEEDCESMRVDDLRPPPQQRVAYEQVLPEMQAPLREEGFEWVDASDCGATAASPPCRDDAGRVSVATGSACAELVDLGDSSTWVMLEREGGMR
jgi:hypothetical protein